MQETFMLISGTIFVVLSIVTAFLFAVGVWISARAVKERKLYANGYRKLLRKHKQYEEAIERSNETVVEKFRHDLDHHAGEQLK